MKYESKKVRTFKVIWDCVTLFLVNILAVTAFALSLTAIKNDMLNDNVMLTRITTIEDSYKDDYRQAVNLDDVTIEIDEDINVIVETKSYQLTTRFDANGNYVSTEIEPKIGAYWVAVIAIWVSSGAIVWILMYFVRDLIADAMTNAEEKKLEKQKAEAIEKIKAAEEAKTEESEEVIILDDED